MSIPQNKVIKFNSWGKTVPSIVSIFADFETLSVSMKTVTPGTDSFSQNIRKLDICSYSYAVISNNPAIKFDFELYRG